jgi:hypothetical protein
MHLTNYSLNKRSSTFNRSERSDEGSKRTISSVLRKINMSGKDGDYVTEVFLYNMTPSVRRWRIFCCVSYQIYSFSLSTGIWFNDICWFRFYTFFNLFSYFTRKVMIRDATEYSPSPNGRCHVVQEYLSHVYIMDRFKFDFRVYVVLKSLEPLDIHICKDGLARFSTVPYETPTNKNLHEKSNLNLSII